jgi:N-acyl-D-amino-acid deacylase
LSGLGASLSAGVLPATAQRDDSPSRVLEEKIPVSGKSAPALQPFDTAMMKIMEHHGLPGAALAIMRDGKLRLAKGYGWADTHTSQVVEPDTLFGLASISKVITAVATMKLVDEGKIDLDSSVFGILAHIKPPAGARPDPRLADITVRQCLNHTGGWDRSLEGDPINWEPQICRAMKLRPPLSPRQFLSFVMSMPLNFAPGIVAIYSNIGYVILGEVIARVSGQSYAAYVAKNVCEPVGMKSTTLHPAAGKYLAGEAIRYLAGSLVGLPPMQLPMVDAAGGWSSSVVDVARLLTNLDGSRGKPILSEKARKLMLEPPPPPVLPRKDGTYFGLGWDSVFQDARGRGFFKEGRYQGMRTFMKRLTNGVSWVLLYNAGMEFDPQDLEIAAGTVHEVRKLIEKLDQFPDIDLFDEY